MKTKLLIVDDSPTIQKIVALTFEKENVEVRGAIDGFKALEMLSSFRADIAIVDVDMPGMTGFELSKKIKSAPGLASIKVLLLASGFEEFDLNKFKDSRADGHITKPFKAEVITKKVKELLSAPPVAQAPAAETASPAAVNPAAGDASGPAAGAAAPPAEPEADALDEQPGNLFTSDLAREAAALFGDDLAPASSPGKPATELSLEELLRNAEEILNDNFDETAAAPETPAAESAPIPAPTPAAAAPAPERKRTAEPPESTAMPPAAPPPPPVPAAENLEPAREEISAVPEMPDHAGDENLADTDLTALDSTDELDAVFASIQDFQQDAPQEAPPAKAEEPPRPVSTPPETPRHETVTTAEAPAAMPKPRPPEIMPEPEDLLERLAPSAFTASGIEGRPDLIQETLDYLSELSPAAGKRKPQQQPRPQTDPRRETVMSNEPIGDNFAKVVGEHIKRILERSLQETIAREISGLSQTIERSVREVVKEVTPEIARALIQEEIEKIKKLEEV